MENHPILETQWDIIGDRLGRLCRLLTLDELSFLVFQWSPRRDPQGRTTYVDMIDRHLGPWIPLTMLGIAYCVGIVVGNPGRFAKIN
jgi:hypothetical protein